MTGSPPQLVGAGITVPLVGGGCAAHTNLDFAASAPALEAVRDAVEEFLPWYSSVHRGAGFKSQISTDAYERARDEVAAFVGAHSDDVVVFTRNTTDSLNVLAAALPEGVRVVTFATEHHANLLPWRRHEYVHLDPGDSAESALQILDRTLAGMPRDAGLLVSITAASNVTGELWPVADFAAVCRRYGARLAVDCAQLAPHAPVDMAGWGADYVALSGHKLYAPYGAGALVGRRDWLDAREPMLRGGGAVAFVTEDEVLWAHAPERQEAGSPNVVGAVALAVACRTLREFGMERLAAKEAALEVYATRGLASIAGVRRHRLWPADHPRIGVLTFTVRNQYHGLTAAALSAEHGVAVRDGCFCAHPLMLRLLGTGEDAARAIRREVANGIHRNVPGAVRMSMGLSTTIDDLDRALRAIREVAGGPRWTYRYDEAADQYVPDPDDRPWPLIAALGARYRVPFEPAGHGASA